MMRLFFLCLFIFAFSAQAADMKFTVVYGEKTSVFEIHKTKSGAELNFNNSDGKKIKRELSQDDFKFLIESAQKYKGENEKRFCERSYVRFESTKKSYFACLGSPTPIAKSLQKTTNLLSLLL